MEAIAVKQFFNCLSDALSSEHPGVFFFTKALQEKLSDIVPEPTMSTSNHDISYLMYRIKQNVLGMTDPVDGNTGKHRDKPEMLIPFACDLLAQRWNEIKDTSEDYTRCSVKTNQLALTFVKQLANFSLKLSDQQPQLRLQIQRWMKVFSPDGNKTEFNIYALLIPTLTHNIVPISLDSIMEYDLHKFVLSKDEKSLISLKNSHDSFERGEGFFNLDVFPSQFFTALEKERIKQKPRDLWPLAIVYTDFIVTKTYPAPALNSVVKNTILHMLDRAEAVELDPRLSFAGFKVKYHENNEPLTPEDIDYLVDIRVAKFRDDERRSESRKLGTADEKEDERRFESDVERLKLSFRADLDISGKAQSDETLSFLALKARQNEIATITAEMLVYCDVLKQEQPDQHQRLMNQVLYDGKTQPKTFYFLLKYVPNAIDCSSVALLTNLKNLFRSQQPHAIPITGAKKIAQNEAEPSVSSVSSGVGGIFSYFYTSSTDSNSRSKSDSKSDSTSESKGEPQSVTDKLAYSPERNMCNY